MYIEQKFDPIFKITFAVAIVSLSSDVDLFVAFLVGAAVEFLFNHVN